MAARRLVIIQTELCLQALMAVRQLVIIQTKLFL